MRNRLMQFALGAARPAWTDILMALAPVAAVVLLNLFVATVEHNIEKGRMLRETQRAETLARALAGMRDAQSGGTLRLARQEPAPPAH